MLAGPSARAYNSRTAAPIVGATPFKNSLPRSYRFTFCEACTFVFLSLLRSAKLLLTTNKSKFFWVKDFLWAKESATWSALTLRWSQFLENRINILLPDVLRASRTAWLEHWRKLIALLNQAPPSRCVHFQKAWSIHRVGLLVGVGSAGYFQGRKTAGIPNASISVHVFWRGAATFTSAVGIPVQALDPQSNWKSPCFEPYVEHDLEFRHNLLPSASNDSFVELKIVLLAVRAFGHCVTKLFVVLVYGYQWNIPLWLLSKWERITNYFRQVQLTFRNKLWTLSRIQFMFMSPNPTERICIGFIFLVRLLTYLKELILLWSNVN